MQTTRDIMLHAAWQTIFDGWIDANRSANIPKDQQYVMMSMMMANLMVYDGERVIRLLEEADMLLPREQVQPQIDLITKLLEIVDDAPM